MWPGELWGQENPSSVVTLRWVCWSLSHASLQCPGGSVSSSFSCLQRRDCFLLGNQTSRPAEPAVGAGSTGSSWVSGVMGWGPLLLASLGARPMHHKDPDSSSCDCGVMRPQASQRVSSSRALAVFPGDRQGWFQLLPGWQLWVQCDVTVGRLCSAEGPGLVESCVGPQALRLAGSVFHSSHVPCLRVYPEIGKYLGISQPQWPRVPRRAAMFAEDLLWAMLDSEPGKTQWVGWSPCSWVVCIIQSLTSRSRHWLLPESVLLPSVLAEALQHPSHWLAPAGNVQPIAHIPGLFPELQMLRSSLLAAFSSWMDYQQLLCLMSKADPFFSLLFQVLLIGIMVFLSPNPLNYVESSFTFLYVTALEQYSTWQLSLKSFESVSFFCSRL